MSQFTLCFARQISRIGTIMKSVNCFLGSRFGVPLLLGERFDLFLIGVSTGFAFRCCLGCQLGGLASLLGKRLHETQNILTGAYHVGLQLRQCRVDLRHQRFKRTIGRKWRIVTPSATIDTTLCECESPHYFRSDSATGPHSARVFAFAAVSTLPPFRLDIGPTKTHARFCFLRYRQNLVLHRVKTSTDDAND